MTKQVALANSTYARLKGRRLPGESFSDAIERLLAHETKDPMSFASRLPPLAISQEEWLAQIKADRDDTWTEA